MLARWASSCSRKLFVVLFFAINRTEWAYLPLLPLFCFGQISPPVPSNYPISNISHGRALLISEGTAVFKLRLFCYFFLLLISFFNFWSFRKKNLWFIWHKIVHVLVYFHVKLLILCLCSLLTHCHQSLLHNNWQGHQPIFGPLIITIRCTLYM